MIAGAVMAMFAMVASLTYQNHGFFTPLFHISAVTGSAQSMMTSVMQAAAGNNWWFTPGAATVGLITHMITAATYGMVFALIARRLPRALLVPAGAMYGLAVFLLSAFIALPIAASITGAGTPISDMASIVGYGTFAVEHLMYGMALGILALLFAPTGAPAAGRAPSN